MLLKDGQFNSAIGTKPALKASLTTEQNKKRCQRWPRTTKTPVSRPEAASKATTVLPRHRCHKATHHDNGSNDDKDNVDDGSATTELLPLQPRSSQSAPTEAREFQPLVLGSHRSKAVPALQRLAAAVAQIRHIVTLPGRSSFSK